MQWRLFGVGCSYSTTTHLAACLDIKSSNAGLCADIQMEMLGAACTPIPQIYNNNSSHRCKKSHSHMHFRSGASTRVDWQNPAN